MADKKAQLIIEGAAPVELPVLSGTLGPDVVDVRGLTSTGHFTFDPGFMSTASCESKITYIDGDKGVLLHRGYPIEQLAEKSDYLETCYLLLNGELPTAEQKEKFVGTIKNHTMVHEQLKTFFNGFRRDAHPMAVMCGVIGALSAFYHDSLDINNPKHREVSAHRLIAKMPTIAAMVYKYSKGEPMMYPRNDLNYAENFLHMMFNTPCETKPISPVLAKAMDRIFILHADHEQNASTSTVRLAGSSGANPFACIASGIAALWGPAHGGANEAVLRMLDEIGDVSNIEKFVAKAKDKNDPFKLMGFGHRVYKNFDPRAKVMKQTCDEVLQELGINDPQLELAMKLEEIARHDPYFVERNLYPNVDFYSGIILKAIGIPTSMFTVIFALARTVGWISHWQEMLSGPYKLAPTKEKKAAPGAAFSWGKRQRLLLLGSAAQAFQGVHRRIDHEAVGQPGRNAATRLGLHLVSHFGHAGALGDQLPLADQLRHADFALLFRDIGRLGLQMTDQAAVGGLLGGHVDHHVAAGHRPGHVDLRVGPGIVAFGLQQAHLGAGMDPLAGAGHVFLQGVDLGHIGLDLDDATVSLVLGTCHGAEEDLHTVVFLLQLPVFSQGSTGKAHHGSGQQGHTQYTTHRLTSLYS